MHRTFFAAVVAAFAITFIQIASAADLPRKAPAYTPLLVGPVATSAATSVMDGDARPSLFLISVKRRECRSWRVLPSVPLRGIPMDLSVAVRSAVIISSPPAG